MRDVPASSPVRRVTKCFTVFPKSRDPSPAPSVTGLSRFGLGLPQLKITPSRSSDPVAGQTSRAFGLPSIAHALAVTTGIGSSTGGGQRSSLPTAFTGKPKERSKWDGVWLQAKECVKSLPHCRCHRLMRVCRWETEEQRLHRTGIAHGGSVGGAPSSPASRQHPGDPRLHQEKDAEDDYAYWQTLPDVDDQASDARSTWLGLEEDT